MAAAFDPYVLKALGRQLFEGLRRLGPPATRPDLRPVTVIVGEHDHPFIDQAVDLAAEVADGRVIGIDGAYHSPQLPTRLSGPSQFRATSIADQRRRFFGV